MREARIGNGDLIQWFLVRPKEENGNEWKKRLESIHCIHHNALLCFAAATSHRGAGNWWLSYYCYTENAKRMKVGFGLVFNNRGGFILSAPFGVEKRATIIRGAERRPSMAELRSGN